MNIYGLDLCNVDTAFSVRYELKSKRKKIMAWKSHLLRDKQPTRNGISGTLRDNYRKHGLSPFTAELCPLNKEIGQKK
jgi:hypothetical protein